MNVRTGKPMLVTDQEILVYGRVYFLFAHQGARNIPRLSPAIAFLGFSLWLGNFDEQYRPALLGVLFWHFLGVRPILCSACVDPERLDHDVNRTLLAGNDCVISIIGQYFNHVVIRLCIIQFGTCIVQGLEDDIHPELHEHRLSVTQQF
jgi:hypothetical protein